MGEEKKEKPRRPADDDSVELPPLDEPKKKKKAGITDTTELLISAIEEDLGPSKEDERGDTQKFVMKLDEQLRLEQERKKKEPPKK